MSFSGRCSPRRVGGAGFISSASTVLTAFRFLILSAYLYHRMPGDEEAQHLLLRLQTQVLIPVSVRWAAGRPHAFRPCHSAVARRRSRRGRRRVLIAQPRCRAATSVPFHRLVHGRHEPRPRPEAVQRTGLDQRLDHALVEQAQVNQLAELPKRLEPARLLLSQLGARSEDRIDRVAATFLIAVSPSG